MIAINDNQIDQKYNYYPYKLEINEKILNKLIAIVIKLNTHFDNTGKQNWSRLGICSKILVLVFL